MKDVIEIAEELLFAFDERVYSLQNPEGVKSVMETREKLAKVMLSARGKEDKDYIAYLRRKLHPLSLLSHLYYYTPPHQENYKANHEIDWSSVDCDALFLKLLSRFDKEENPYLWGNHDIPFGKSFVNSKEGRLSIESVIRYDVVPWDEIKIISLRLLDEMYEPKKINRPYPAILDFAYEKKEGSEEWDLRHRLIAEQYRGQGIATKIISLMQDFLRSRQMQKEISQFITVKTALAPIIFLLLNNKFVPSSQSDQEKLERFLSGDSELTLVSSPDNRINEEPLHWLIFKKKILKSERAAEIWSSDRENDMHFLNSSFRIQFKKAIT